MHVMIFALYVTSRNNNYYNDMLIYQCRLDKPWLQKNVRIYQI